MSNHDYLKQTSMTSKYKGYTKPLHLQDHKNESSIIIKCMQITKYHNNAKIINSFLCPFSIDSWWKTSMRILFQMETKNNKEKTWCIKKSWWTKEVHDQAKNAYILSFASWKFLKILGNGPFHNLIQTTLTSKVAFSKIMEYRILLQKVLPFKGTK